MSSQFQRRSQKARTSRHVRRFIRENVYRDCRIKMRMARNRKKLFR